VCVCVIFFKGTVCLSFAKRQKRKKKEATRFLIGTVKHIPSQRNSGRGEGETSKKGKEREREMGAPAETTPLMESFTQELSDEERFVQMSRAMAKETLSFLRMWRGLVHSFA